MLTPFHGEFLLNPVPLHLRLTQCTYNCVYCYARGKSDNRIIDYRQVVATLNRSTEKEYENKLLYYLVKHKYPVAISNQSDPFCPSNWQETNNNIIPLLDAFDLPVFWETKGSHKDIKHIYNRGRREVWYVTITTDQEDIAKKFEPLAPSIEQRLDLIQELIKYGNKVVVGVNPYVNGWWRDIIHFFSRLKAMGVNHIWTQNLHLSADHTMRMTAGEKEALRGCMGKAMRAVNKEVFFLQEEVKIAGDLTDISVYYVGMPELIDFWKPFREIYRRTFPTILDFSLYLKHKAEKKNAGFLVITYNDYKDFMLSLLPKHCDLRSEDYLGAINHLFINREINMHGYRGFEPVLWVFWDVFTFSHSIGRLPHYSYLLDPRTKELLTDDEGNLLVYFNPSRLGAVGLYIDHILLEDIYA